MIPHKKDLEMRIMDNICGAITQLVDSKNKEYSLLFFDIDYFKAINDLYSHDQGDEVIKGINLVLHEIKQSNMPFIGVVGNYGGDEFLMAIPYKTMGDAYEIAEKLRSSITNYKF